MWPSAMRMPKRFGKSPAFASVLGHDAASVVMGALARRPNGMTVKDAVLKSALTRACSRRFASTPMAMRNVRPTSWSFATVVSCARQMSTPKAWRLRDVSGMGVDGDLLG